LKTILILLLALSLFTGCTGSTVRKPAHDTLPVTMDTGIAIDAQEFRILVEKYLAGMEAASAMTIEDYIIMVRLWNTIDVFQLAASDALYKLYADAFFPAYAELISKALHALPTKGMALYSKEYDIYIGGNPHANSQYKLTKKP